MLTFGAILTKYMQQIVSKFKLLDNLLKHPFMLKLQLKFFISPMVLELYIRWITTQMKRKKIQKPNTITL